MSVAINSTATVFPECHVSTREISLVAEEWLKSDAEKKEKFLRIAAQSGVSDRRFILPYSEILQPRGLEKRAELFEKHALPLLAEVIDTAIRESDYEYTDIESLIFTSCSVPVIPSIDAAVILQGRLKSTISRIPIYQHGCAGGVVGLALGAKLARLGQPVVVCSVELCSLVFQPHNSSGSHLVGAALFADGAAAAVLSPELGQVKVLDSLSELLPNTRFLMGYDLFDDGFHLRLDRGLPSHLVNAIPNILQAFLKKNCCIQDEIDYWLFHPGGIKILDFLGETLRLDPSQCRWSYETLREHGNMSSATILCVLDSFLRSGEIQKNQKALIMGIGPGLTVELILLQGTE